jgi:transposase InsO family protein
MPWKEVTVMDERTKFVSLANEKIYTFKKLCEKFNISRKTGYKWVKRCQKFGVINGVKNESSKPKNISRKTEQNIETKFVKLRQKHPSWGARKLIELAKNDKKNIFIIPSERTVNRIIERNGLKTEKSPSGIEYKRFEHEKSNDLWQMDHKGEFMFGDEKKYCYPLTLLDDHSRYNLCIDANERLSWFDTKNSLIKVFRENGLPRKMLMDHGGLWFNLGRTDLKWTRLSVWLIRLGIEIIYSRIRHPQTQGKIERFHRTLKYDCINRNKFKNLAQIQRTFDDFRFEYNEIRPHDGINLQKPAQRYKKSSILYTEKFEPIYYDSDSVLKKVSPGGYISFKGNHWFISEALTGEFVKLKELDERYEIYFINTYLKTINVKTKTWEI